MSGKYSSGTCRFGRPNHSPSLCFLPTIEILPFDLGGLGCRFVLSKSLGPFQIQVWNSPQIQATPAGPVVSPDPLGTLGAMVGWQSSH